MTEKGKTRRTSSEASCRHFSELVTSGSKQIIGKLDNLRSNERIELGPDKVEKERNLFRLLRQEKSTKLRTANDFKILLPGSREYCTSVTSQEPGVMEPCQI